MTLAADEIVHWQAQPGPQQQLLRCPIFEVLYGGARGGGKTDAMLGEWVQHAGRYGKHAIGRMFRRERTQLVETIARAQELFMPLGAKWKEVDKMFTFPDGARLGFAYLEHDKDAEAYQGSSFCVAVGTRIRMADGRLKPIERIAVGEMVATLEGPRRVSATLQPYAAPCVRALVRDDFGAARGEQIHPAWHPVLSTAGLIWQRKSPTRRTAGQPQHETDAPCRSAAELPPDADRARRVWPAWSTDGQSDCRASSRSRREVGPLEPWCVPVVLHVPSDLSERSHSLALHRESIRSRYLDKWFLPASGLVQGWRRSSTYLRLLGARVRSELGHFCPALSSALAYALSGSGTEQGLYQSYWSGSGLGGVLSHAWSGSVPGGTRRQADVGEQLHASLRDGSDTTLSHIPVPTLSWVHPYTGEERRLAEPVVTGTMEVTAFGNALVTDLTVEGANHYISECGLINKNTRVYIEEVGNFPEQGPVKKLMATLRSAHGVPCRFRATANPGGPGHQWVKARYIDPAPAGYQIITDPDSGLRRVYIPAKIIDNPALLNNDPTYVARLRSVGSDQLVRAWLEGDWDIVEGAYFDNWVASRHVMRPVELPATWTRFRALDWGSARPFSVGWYAVSDGTRDAFPSGALVHYREWYGMKDNQPNVGVKMDVEAVAAGILERDAGDEIKYGIADPAIFAADGGPSIAERFFRAGVPFRRGDNKRIPGWQQVRARLNGEDGRPMLHVFSTCAHLIRTLPSLQHDEHKLEDVDTDGEDHAADSMRYALMSRPYAAPLADEPATRWPHELTMDELIARRLERSSEGVRV